MNVLSLGAGGEGGTRTRATSWGGRLPYGAYNHYIADFLPVLSVFSPALKERFILIKPHPRNPATETLWISEMPCFIGFSGITGTYLEQAHFHNMP